MKRKRLLSMLLAAVLVFTLLSPVTVLAAVTTAYIDSNGYEQTVEATPIDSETGTLSTGWYVGSGEFTRAGTITVSGDVHLILADDSSLTVTGTSDAGINVSIGNSLTIYGQENGTGQLTANGGGSSAGIGGGSYVYGHGGTVTINGGTITATGPSAGIGGGNMGSGGTVTINGGTVTANGGRDSAGIGSGDWSLVGTPTINGGTVTINGGTVTANGGAGYGGGAGIGGGYEVSGGTVIITGGTVTATGASGEYGAAAGIGGGSRGYSHPAGSGGNVIAKSLGIAAEIGCGGGGSESGTLTNGTDIVSKVIVTLNGVNADTAVDSVTAGSIGSPYSYGTKDMKTTGDGKLYVYLPQATDITVVRTTDGADAPTYTEYTGSRGGSNVVTMYIVVAPDITTASLPDTHVGESYSQKIEATGYPSPTLTISNGSLPAGLSLLGNTISGIPTEQGTFYIQVKATNMGGEDTQDLSIFVGESHGKYYITFHANGGTGTMAAQHGYISEPQTLNPNAFTREGFTFDGWNTEQDGSGMAYTDGQTVILTADIDLYAQWTEPVNTVTFDKNGGNTEASPAAVNVDYGETTALPAANPTRAGYTFGGWNTETDGTGTDFTASTPVYRDVTVYAMWFENLTAGHGTEGSPYLIGTAGQLRSMAFFVNSDNASYGDKYYKLTADIDLGAKWTMSDGGAAATLDSGRAWAAVGFDPNDGINNPVAFSGVFDGDYHTVSGLYINNNLRNQGLFGYVGGATIDNLGVVDSYIQGSSCVGGLVGYAIRFIDYDNLSYTGDGTTIRNCYNTGTVVGSGIQVGGIVGILYDGSVTGCYNTGRIIADISQAGGVAGSIATDRSTQIKNCYNAGEISGTTRIGGLVGWAGAEVKNCYNIGPVSASGSEAAGAVVGYANYGSANPLGIDLINCYFLEGTAASGVGQVSGSGSGSTDTTKVTAEELSAGEICYLFQEGESDLVWGQTALGGTNFPQPAYTSGVKRVVRVNFYDDAAAAGTFVLQSTEYNVTGGTVTFPDLTGVTWLDSANNIYTESSVFSADTDLYTSQTGRAPIIITDSLSDGKVGELYSVALSATGEGPITWSKLGSLPGGLTLDDSGIISGIPTAAGTFNFSLMASNSAGDSAVEAFSITINPAPTYSVSLDQTGTYTFTGQLVGYGSVAPLTVTVSNTGDQTTGDLTVSLSGDDTGSFTLSTGSISSIAASGSDAFTVSPNTGLSPGTHAATVTVSGGHGINASFTVSFTVSVAPTTHEVGNAMDLQNALAIFADGDTIKLTAGIDSNQNIYIDGKSVTFDTNGHTLNIEVTDDYALSARDSGHIYLTDSSTEQTGVLNVKTTATDGGYYTAVYVNEGSSAEVTSADIIVEYGNCYAVSIESGSTCTVYGNVTATGDYGKAVYAAGSTVTVHGNVTATGANGKAVYAVDSTVTVDGAVSTTDPITLCDESSGSSVQLGLADGVLNTESGYFEYKAAGYTAQVKVKGWALTVDPSTASVQKGNQQTFTAKINGADGPQTTATWSVSGGGAGTSIDLATGLLTVAADETAGTLTVTATSTVDGSKSGTATVTVTSASVINAMISPDTGSFDKYAPTDVQTTITWGSATGVTDVKANGISISAGNYSVSSNTLTIKKEYLTAQPTGSLALTVEFDAGASAILTIAISDTTPPTISPVSRNFDLNAPADVTTTIAWNSASSVTDVVYSVSPYTTLFTLDTGDYTVAVNDLTINNSFLSGLSLTTGAVLNFNINFNTGATVGLMVNVVDGYVPGSDADLSSLFVNGTPVSGFDPDDTEYNVELPYGSSSATVAATTSDPNAGYTVSPAPTLPVPGTATVTVTAEDGTPKTYTINFTIGAAPIVTVTNITVTGTGGVSSVQVGNTMQMLADVLPANATDRNVTWSIEAGSGADISTSGLLTATAEGSVTVRATAQDGSGVYGEKVITVTTAPPAFVPVTGITGVPTAATVGIPLTLSGTVSPADATNQTIVWSVQSVGTTGATISGNALSTTTAGTVTVRATITNGQTETTDYTQDFTITVSAAPVTTYTVTFYSNGSVYTTKTVNAGQSIGSVAWPADPTRNNYTFGGWVTGENGAGAQFTSTAPVNATTTVYAKWTYSGGGGGGGGGSTPSTPTYKAEVKAGNGDEATLSVTVNKDNGTASIDMGSQRLTSGGTVITIPSIPDVDTYSVGIQVPELSTTGEQGTLTLETDIGNITVPSNMLTGVSGISGSKAEITIGQGDKDNLPNEVKAAIGDRPLVQLSLSIGGKQTDWNNPDAPVTVSIPYTPTAEELKNPESIVIWYIDGNGKAVSVPNGRYDPATGTVTFDATHFSYYAVGYNKVSFNDMAAGAWYNKAVSFIAARGITGGTGNGNYSPDAKLTRGEFLVMLMKAYGIALDENPTNNFSDAGNTYYTDYLAAAKRLGITAGVGNNMFAPEKEITRQEMFALLYNALKVIGQLPRGDSDKKLSDFSDARQIDAWAKDAMTLLVRTGTVGGSNGKLSPLNTTTRAEIAQVLYNLLGK